MGAPYIEDAPAQSMTEIPKEACLSGRNVPIGTGKKVTISLLLLFGLTGVAYAAYRLTSTGVPKSGTEKAVVLHLSSPYGSLAVTAGVEPSRVARLDLQSEADGTQTAMFMRYTQTHDNIGLLRISIGEDEGMLQTKPPLAVWHANNYGSGLTTANYIAGDNGSFYSYAPRPDPPILAAPRPFDNDAQDYKAHLFLTRDLPISLRAELGFGESLLDLTGLSLERTSIETGASKVRVNIGAPNPVAMSVYQVSAGLGECRLDGICNSNASKFEFDGGIGYYALDFGGQLTRNMDANISVGLGKVAISIPPTAGRLQVFYDDNLFSSYSFSGLARRRSGYATSVGFDRSNAPTLTLRLSSGMGKMTVSYH